MVVSGVGTNLALQYSPTPTALSVDKVGLSLVFCSDSIADKNEPGDEFT